MKGSTHLTIGIASGLGLSVILGADVSAAAIITACAAVGSLLPDIDHPKSTISYKAGLARAPLFWLSHRGITHSALILLALVFFGQSINLTLTQAVSVGYSSHILADMLTRAGVPLLWPIQTRFRLMPKIFMGWLCEWIVWSISVMICFLMLAQLVFVVWAK